MNDKSLFQTYQVPNRELSLGEAKVKLAKQDEAVSNLVSSDRSKRTESKWKLYNRFLKRK